MEGVSKSQDFLNKIKQKLKEDKQIAVVSEKAKILKEKITKAKTQDEIAKVFTSEDLQLVVDCLKSLIEQNYTNGQACNMIFNLDVTLKEEKESSNTVLVAISELLKESQFSAFNQKLNHAIFYKHVKNFMLKGFKTRTQIQDFSRSYLDTKNPKDAFIVLDYLIKGCKKDESDVDYNVISPMEYIILKCRYAGLAIMFADMSKSKVLSKPQQQASSNVKQSSLTNEHQKILYDYKKGYESGQKDLMLNAVSELMKSDNPQELIEALADMDVDTLIEALNSETFSPEAVAGLFAILPADVIANIFSKVENDKKKLAALFALLNKVYKGDKSPNKDIYKKLLKNLDYQKLQFYFNSIQQKAQKTGKFPAKLNIISEERAAAMALKLKPSDLLLIMEQGGQVASAIARNLPAKYKEMFKGLPAFELVKGRDDFIKSQGRGYDTIEMPKERSKINTAEAKQKQSLGLASKSTASSESNIGGVQRQNQKDEMLNQKIDSLADQYANKTYDAIRNIEMSLASRPGGEKISRARITEMALRQNVSIDKLTAADAGFIADGMMSEEALRQNEATKVNKIVEDVKPQESVSQATLKKYLVKQNIVNDAEERGI
jgi:hypothetical protein